MTMTNMLTVVKIFLLGNGTRRKSIIKKITRALIKADGRCKQNNNGKNTDLTVI